MNETFRNARQIQEDLVSMRRHLHAHPELNFVEYETSKFAAEKLRGLGFNVRAIGGETGLVADFGEGEKVVAIRCDMDALPIGELNRSVYASRNPGVMHACGHDAHLAVALGVAQLLVKEDLPGRLRIIVQPGDDGGGQPGAVTMIEAGALEGVGSVLGLHVDGTIPTGKVGIVASPAKACAQHFVVEFKDDGEADEFADTSLATANLVRALYGIPALIAPHSEEITISVDSMHCENDLSHAGGRHAKVEGRVKTFNDEISQRARSEIEKVSKSVRNRTTVSFRDSRQKSIDNSHVSATMYGAAVEVLGATNVLSIKRKSWNSQFSLLTEHVPGAMIYLGAEIASSRRSHQSATFDIDENCLPVGVAVLAETAMRLLWCPLQLR
jgi:amidohydrolase